MLIDSPWKIAMHVRILCPVLRHGNSLKHHATDKARSSSRLYNFANTLPPLFVICFMSKSLDLNHFLLNSLTYKSPNETVLPKSLYGTNA